MYSIYVMTLRRFYLLSFYTNRSLLKQIQRRWRDLNRTHVRKNPLARIPYVSILGRTVNVTNCRIQIFSARINISEYI